RLADLLGGEWRRERGERMLSPLLMMWLTWQNHALALRAFPRERVAGLCSSDSDPDSLVCVSLIASTLISPAISVSFWSASFSSLRVCSRRPCASFSPKSPAQVFTHP